MKNFLELENELNFFYVKAHNGEVYNERVDDIARIMAETKGQEPKLFRGPLK
jgi:ribonuclease HI